MRGPFEEAVQRLHLGLLVEVAHAELVEAPQAEVVLAAYAEGHAEVAEDGLEERDVLFDDLLLEGLGVGGHDDAAVLVARPEDERDEVGQALADAGARLDDQVGLAPERLPDGLGHLHLLGTELVGLSHGVGDEP